MPATAGKCPAPVALWGLCPEHLETGMQAVGRVESAQAEFFRGPSFQRLSARCCGLGLSCASDLNYAVCVSEKKRKAQNKRGRLRE